MNTPLPDTDEGQIQSQLLREKEWRLCSKRRNGRIHRLYNNEGMSFA